MDLSPAPKGVIHLYQFAITQQNTIRHNFNVKFSVRSAVIMAVAAPWLREFGEVTFLRYKTNSSLTNPVVQAGAEFLRFSCIVLAYFDMLRYLTFHVIPSTRLK